MSPADLNVIQHVVHRPSELRAGRASVMLLNRRRADHHRRGPPPDVVATPGNGQTRESRAMPSNAAAVILQGDCAATLASVVEENKSERHTCPHPPG